MQRAAQRFVLVAGGEKAARKRKIAQAQNNALKNAHCEAPSRPVLCWAAHSYKRCLISVVIPANIHGSVNPGQGH